jgi:hypothetical protein
MAFGLVAAGQMASTLFPSTSILITDCHFWTWAMSLVARMTPYWHTVSASSRAKPCYPDGQSNPGKRAGKRTFKFKPSRIGSIGHYLVARMVIHSREANPTP